MTQFHYMIVAKRHGSNRDMRMLHSLGMHDSPEAAIAAASARAGRDRRLRKRFAGHELCPMIVDFNVKILANEAVVLFKNQSEDVKLWSAPSPT